MLSLDRAESELIVLRALTPADITERYLEWFRNPLVTLFLEARNLTRAESVDYMEYGRRTRNYFVYAICDRQAMLHIGNIKIGPIAWRHGVSDLVTLIGDTRYWGGGYAEDAIRTASRIAFEVLRLRKLSGSIHSNNFGSLRVYTRSGFQIEARLADQYLIEGGLGDRIFVSQFNPRLSSTRLSVEPDRTTNLRVLAIVQARMSSTRLPGKVLKPLSGQPALIRMLERVRRSRHVDKVVVATSTHASDDCLAALCQEHGIFCSRGDLEDVLDRFYRAASGWRPEYVVRLTADCPLSDPEIIDRCIEECIASKADYAGNAVERTYPDGLDVEVMRYSSLQQAWIEADSPLDREHVTPFFYRNPQRFRLHDVRNTEDYSLLRWTVDEEADYKLVARVFDKLYPENPAFGWKDVLEYLGDPSAAGGNPAPGNTLKQESVAAVQGRE